MFPLPLLCLWGSYSLVLLEPRPSCRPRMQLLNLMAFNALEEKGFLSGLDFQIQISELCLKSLVLSSLGSTLLPWCHLFLITSSGLPLPGGRDVFINSPDNLCVSLFPPPHSFLSGFITPNSISVPCRQLVLTASLQNLSRSSPVNGPEVTSW